MLWDLPYLLPLCVNTSWWPVLQQSSIVVIMSVPLSLIRMQESYLSLCCLFHYFSPLYPGQCPLLSCLRDLKRWLSQAFHLHTSIHPSIQQWFPENQIPARVHCVGADSGMHYPSLFINFLPTLLLLIPNSWPWTSGSWGFNASSWHCSVVLFCFSWKPPAPGTGTTESSSWADTWMFSKQASFPPSL